jgi:outer membrane murein-binding lipoprotein Lpp
MKPFLRVAVLVLILAVLSGCTSNSKYQVAIDDNASLSSQVSDLNGQVADLNAQVTQLQGKYDQIAKLYPPRDFATLQELKDWLAKDKTDTLSPAATIEIQYSRGLSQQLAALKDGFIMSVDQEFVTDEFFFIFGIAVINGDLWLWDIDTDDPYEPIGWGKVSRG